MMSTDTATTTLTNAQPTTLQQQAGLLLGQVAGYMAHRTVEMGLRSGLIRAIATTPDVTPDDLAGHLGMDAFYVSVWCRGAFAAGVLDRAGAGYRLAPHLDTLLLDASSPAYVGGLYQLVLQPEMFGRFGDSLTSGHDCGGTRPARTGSRE